MNRLILLLAIILFASSCSNEQKAKKAIETYLSKTLHDFKSYEAVEFGKIDSSFTFFMDAEEFKTLDSRFDELVRAGHERDEASKSLHYSNERNLEIINDLIEKHKFGSDSMRIIREKIEEFEHNFVREFNGYVVLHSFRAKNANGALVLSEKFFVLSPQLDKVINVIEPNKD